MKFIEGFRKFHGEEAGQDLLEYSLVLGTVLAAVVVGSDNISALLANGMTTLGSRIASIAG